MRFSWENWTDAKRKFIGRLMMRLKDWELHSDLDRGQLSARCLREIWKKYGPLGSKRRHLGLLEFCVGWPMLLSLLLFLRPSLRWPIAIEERPWVREAIFYQNRCFFIHGINGRQDGLGRLHIWSLTRKSARLSAGRGGCNRFLAMPK